MAGVPFSRGGAALAGGAAVVAGSGLLGFAAQLLVALGVARTDSLIRLLLGVRIEPWNLRSLVYAVAVGAATAAFLPALLRGLAGGAMTLRKALVIGTLAGLANLVIIDHGTRHGADHGSTGWQLAVALAAPLAAGVLAELSTR